MAVHGHHAVQGAADAHAAAVSRDNAGQPYRLAHGGDRRLHQIPRVLLLPAVLGLGTRVLAHPETENLAVLIHCNRFAAAGPKVYAEKP